MTRRTVAAGLLFLAAAVGCQRSGLTPKVTGLYGGQANVLTIKSPDKVEAFRVQPEPSPMGSADAMVGPYLATAGPVRVDGAGIRMLRNVLLSDTTYMWDVAKACEFMPGVGFRFHKSGAPLEVALCFSCDELAIWRAGKKLGSEDFDSARPHLVALVKRLFPDDPKLQALR